MDTIKYWLAPCILLLSACSSTPHRTDESAGTKVNPIRESRLDKHMISSWDINGAIAAKNKSKAWSASMNWVQNGPNAFHIRLIGPLGSGSLLITKSGHTTTFQDGDKTSSSTNAEELLLKQTGIQLPVNDLYFWVRGLPAPGKVQLQRHDQHNNLTQLNQAGYTIYFTQYISVKGIDVPRMIRLEGDGMMVKLIIKKWGFAI